MKTKQTVSGAIFDIFNIIFMLFMILICFYPFWYIVVCSFTDGGYLIGDVGAILWPKKFTLDGYAAVLQNKNIFNGYKMTILILVLGTLVNLVMTSIGAFIVTRKHFMPAKIMMKLMIFTMYFGGGMIPSYLLIVNVLHLHNSIWSLILPGAISTYNLIIMKTNFMAIPDSLEESAEIDGASDWTVFSRIIIPLSKPVIAVMVLYYGVAHWNSWFNAMLYIDDTTKYPLQLVLREILILNSTNDMTADAGDVYALAQTIKYSTIIVATLPILCMYPFIQKYFIKGMLVGAVKG
ncbi:MAG: carbohydrate ABC transporter permease [Clostridia bacterium]|nr:carbohydrate ABC transporter permease [Clostridia bacterium]